VFVEPDAEGACNFDDAQCAGHVCDRASFAVERGYVEKNSAHGVVIREVDSKEERRFCSADQARMWLGVLTEPCATVVAVAVLTGMRIGEILALRRKRIDLLGATIEVAENYSSGEFGSPKTKSSRRVLPISSALAHVIENHRVRMNRDSPEELIFQTPKGTPLNPKKPVQPRARASVRPDRAAANFVALVPTHPRDALICKRRVSQDGAGPARAFGS
jgi:integrase